MIFIDAKYQEAAQYFALEEFLCTQKQFDDGVFMLWQTRPTVMLGNFQNSFNEIRLAEIEKNHVDLVRRNTGGGTIYTDEGSLQYTFVVKSASEMIDFKTYMDKIIEALHTLGVEVAYNSRNDLAMNGKKISGNAQCNKGEYTIHHGSLLYDMDFSKMAKYLNPPKYKIESKGIKSVRDRTGNISDCLSEKWDIATFRQKLIAEILKNDYQPYQLTEKEEVLVEQLAQDKFRSWDWTFGKNPAFTMVKAKKFPAGFLEVSLNIQHGIIQNCAFHGDFFSYGDLNHLEQALANQTFTYETVKQILIEQKADQLFYQITIEEILACIFE